MTTNLLSSDKRALGQFQVGPVAFGCWRFVHDDIAVAQSVVEHALGLGMNLVDTADVYGLDWGGTGFGLNEEILGRVLANAPELRPQMVLATKGGILPPTPYNSGADYLREACEASLRRLQTDVIDLYQIHRPDLYTHPAEVADTLVSLRSEGKIREVGVSNFTPTQTEALQHFLPFSLVSDQPQFSVTHLDPLWDGTADAAMMHNRILLAWSPLGGGALATGEGLEAGLLAVIDELAEREAVSRAALAVAFVLAHPSKPVAVVGSQNPDRLTDMMSAVDVHLDRADVYRLIQASMGQPLP